MRGSMIKSLRNSKGQSLVETALILPLIILLLMGMVEFTRIFGSYLIITHASREGARLAAIGKSDEEVILNVKSKAGLLSASAIEVDLTPDDDSRISGSDVCVTVEYAVVIYTPILSGIIPNPLNMESNTYMRVE